MRFSFGVLKSLAIVITLHTSTDAISEEDLGHLGSTVTAEQEKDTRRLASGRGTGLRGGTSAPGQMYATSDEGGDLSSLEADFSFPDDDPDDPIVPDDDPSLPDDDNSTGFFDSLPPFEGPFDLTQEGFDLIPIDLSETEQPSYGYLPQDPRFNNSTATPTLLARYGPYKLRNLATSKMLDSNSKGNVYTLGHNGGNYQKWYFYTTSYSRTYILLNVATGRALDSNAKGKVYTLRSNGGSYQKWKLFTVGHYRVLQNLATSRVLDSNAGGKAYTLGYNGGSYQKWSLFR